MKKFILYTSLFVLSFGVLNSCQESQNSEKNMAEVSKTVPHETLQKGFEILESNCFSCHSPNGSLDDRIAPSISSIKESYLNKITTREEFIKVIVSFVSNPTEKNSKMPDAVKKYNLMPKLGYSDEQIAAVAEYLYATEVEKPEWFQNHFKNEQEKYSLNTSKDINYLEKGQKMAMQSKSVLGKNLMENISAKGTDGALDFCNIKAIPLIDSMSVYFDAKIKRVSDLPRNANNLGNSDELKYIKDVKQVIGRNEEPRAMLIELEDKVVGYYPILTNQMCLQCHGKPKTQIKESTLSLLSKLYPNDKAIGYNENELRGIWVIEFDK